MKARVRGTCILLQFVRWRLSFVQCWCPWLQSIISFPLQVRWISLGFSPRSLVVLQLSNTAVRSTPGAPLSWLFPLISSRYFGRHWRSSTTIMVSWQIPNAKCHVDTALILQFFRRELGALYFTVSILHISQPRIFWCCLYDCRAHSRPIPGPFRAHSCPSECARRNHISGDIEFLGFNCHSFSALDVKM